jgi:hypothetical protein
LSTLTLQAVPAARPTAQPAIKTTFWAWLPSKGWRVL